MVTGMIIISTLWPPNQIGFQLVTWGFLLFVFQVGAIHGSPEYNLGIRRNAIIDRGTCGYRGRVERPQNVPDSGVRFSS